MLTQLVTEPITTWGEPLSSLYNKMAGDHPAAPGSTVGEVFSAGFLATHDAWRPHPQEPAGR